MLEQLDSQIADAHLHAELWIEHSRQTRNRLQIASCKHLAAGWENLADVGEKLRQMLLEIDDGV